MILNFVIHEPGDRVFVITEWTRAETPRLAILTEQPFPDFLVTPDECRNGTLNKGQGHYLPNSISTYRVKCVWLVIAIRNWKNYKFESWVLKVCCLFLQQQVLSPKRNWRKPSEAFKTFYSQWVTENLRVKFITTKGK